MKSLRSNPFVEVAVSLLIYITPFCADAQYFTGAVASGAGGAGRAAAEASETTLLNPAVLAHAQKFSSGFFYKDGSTGRNESQALIGLNLVDNSSGTLFPGAIAFIQGRRRFASLGPVDETYWNVSLGNFAYRQLAIGLSVVYLRSRLGANSTHSQWNGVFGLHYNPHPDLGMAFVFYNLATASEDVPIEIRQLSKLSVAATYILSKFVRARFDLSQIRKVNPDQKFDLQLGIESFLNDFVILRLGMESNGFYDRSILTTGLSFNGPRFKLDYAYAKNQTNTLDALHSVDLRIPF